MWEAQRHVRQPLTPYLRSTAHARRGACLERVVMGLESCGGSSAVADVKEYGERMASMTGAA